MKKRMFSFLLALMLIVGLIPATAVTANAVGGSQWNTSTNAVKILVEKQGFSANVYKKDGKFYVGYGSIVKDSAGKEVATEAAAKALFPDAITETKALSLVQDELKESIDKKINAFTEKNTIQLTQNQHDALALYSHRVGTDWMSYTSNASNALNIAVRARKTGTEFIKAIVGQPSLDNLEALKVSMNLRLSEANMYLNGMYGYNRPGSMSYAVLDNNGTKELVIYETSKGYALNPSSATGKAFFGWYVADGNGKPSGAAITKLTGDHYGKLIVAKFDKANDYSAASYKINTSSLPSRNFYNAPMDRATLAKATPWGVLGNNTTFTVSYEWIVGSDFKWVYGEGKNDKGQGISQVWVPLGDFSTSIKPTEKPVASATITTATNLYYGASLNSGYAGQDVLVGQTYNVYATQEEKSESGNILWGRISVNGVVGWINLKNAKVVYTTNTSTSPVGKNGKIINAEEVNVRDDANVVGTAILTTLKKGTQVTILETKMNGENQWMRVRWSGLKDGYQEGWVYAYYIEVEGAPHSNPGNAANSGTVKYTGVVTSNINLNVRKSPDVYAPKARSLPRGTKVNITETATSRGMKWGCIGVDEWVCLTYVKLTEVPNSGNNSNSGATSTTEIQATVTSATLDVMKSYNNNSAKVGTLKKGDVVPVLERNTEKTGTGTRIWGRIKKDNLEGWINLAYAEVKTVTTVVNPGNTGTDNSTSGNANGAAAVIANCMAVNVREDAGTANRLKVKLNQGTTVKVYEKKTVDNAPWSRITWDNGASEGWVCMYYVEMKATGGTTGGNTNGNNVGNTNSNTISAVGTVNSNIALNVRAGAGLGFAKIGSLNKGAKVTVYEQVSADGMIWGRIPFNKGYGWICMSYINVDNVTSSGKGVMGTIARCFKAVNVRSAPGTNNALVATINVGSRVEVFEKKLYSGQYWGRVAQGWICMDYVLLDSELPPDVKLDAPETTKATTATESTKETVNRDNEVLYTVKGKTTAEVEIHNDASATSLKVGSLMNGMELRILGIKINNAGELWGRVDDYAGSGWVNMKNVSYEVKGYVNTDEQPVYLNADAGSTIKGKLTLNTELSIKSLTLNGSTVYGWVESLLGWIPMGRVSDDPVATIPVYDATQIDQTFGHQIDGKTNATIDVLDSINGSKVLFRVKAGSDVKIGAIRTDYGRVWGSIRATTAGTVSGWADLSGVNYTVSAKVPSGTKVYNTKDLNLDDSNVFETINLAGGAVGDVIIELCKISFDATGGRWGTLTSNGKFVYLGTGVNVNGLEG